MRDKTTKEVFPKDPNKTYGLMALVEDTTPMVEKEPEDTEFTWPHLVYRELIYAICAFIILHLLSLLFNAPLEEIANPMRSPNPAKAPWYFVGLQELVHYSAFIGGIMVPFLIIIGLVLLPYIDRSPKGVGIWFSRDRKFAITIFTLIAVGMIVLIIIGTFFRGPGWHWYWPWQEWPTVQ